MNINLVFPPFVSPSCIPIGIASLKAYIEEHLPAARVSSIDLNLPFVTRILDGKLHGLPCVCKIGGTRCPYTKDACPFQGVLVKEQREIFRKARHIVKDRALFLNEEIFQRYMGDCLAYTSSVDRCLTALLTRYNERRLAAAETLERCFNDEIRTIMSGEPDMIGFSVLVEGQLNYALALAKMVKRRYSVPVVLGGPALFNFNMEEFMAAFPFIDFVITKEGELAIVGLARHLQRHAKEYDAVPNLFWRRGSQAVANGIRCIENLDDLPTPDFSGLPLRDYFSPSVILPVSSSRGCPWSRCKFCQLNAQYLDAYRERSIGKVIADIRTLQKRHGAIDFFFTDSEISAGRLEKLGKRIIGSKLHMYFGCYARPTKNLSLDVLRTVHRAGGRFLQLGVESLSDRFLSFTDKGTTARSIRAALRNTHAVGIRNLVYMLACCPRQTRKELLGDLREIAALQRKYGIFSVTYCLYGLGKHQRLYGELQKHGIVARPSRPVFTTAQGLRVHRTDWLPYGYKGRGAYHILATRAAAGKLYSRNAPYTLDLHCNAFGLNSGKNAFIHHINNFLFETQLLYCRRSGRRPGRSPAEREALRFYTAKKADMLAAVYRNARASSGPRAVSRSGQNHRHTR